MNWRRLLNREPDLRAESFPIFNISVTKIVQKDASRVFMMPSPDTMNFIATVGDGLIYLSSPYSSGGTVGGDELVDRVESTKKMLFTLMNMGVAAFSPIVSGTGMTPYGEDKEHSWWMHWDLKLLRKCDCVAVLVLDGWEMSSGVRQEIELATILGKPIYLVREIQ